MTPAGLGEYLIVIGRRRLKPEASGDNQTGDRPMTQVTDIFAKISMAVLTGAAFVPLIAAALNLPH